MNNTGSSMKLNKRQLQAKMTKQRIVSKALKILEKKALEQTTVKEICDAAGISTGAFYHYFDSKERMMVERYIQIDKTFRLKKSELQDSSLMESIWRCVEWYTKTAEDDGVKVVAEVYRALLSLRIPFPRHEKYGVHHCLSQLVEAAQAAGELTNGVEVAVIVDEMLAIMRGLIFEWCQERGSFALTEKTKKVLSRYLKNF